MVPLQSSYMQRKYTKEMRSIFMDVVCFAFHRFLLVVAAAVAVAVVGLQNCVKLGSIYLFFFYISSVAQFLFCGF